MTAFFKMNHGANTPVILKAADRVNRHLLTRKGNRGIIGETPWGPPRGPIGAPMGTMGPIGPMGSMGQSLGWIRRPPGPWDQGTTAPWAPLGPRTLGPLGPPLGPRPLGPLGPPLGPRTLGPLGTPLGPRTLGPLGPGPKGQQPPAYWDASGCVCLSRPRKMWEKSSCGYLPWPSVHNFPFGPIGSRPAQYAGRNCEGTEKEL